LVTFPACRGEYIALLEGDDYWSDPNKLQQQIDVLSGDQSLSASFHNALTIINDDISTGRFFSAETATKRYTIKDVLLLPWFIPTASVVFRKKCASMRKWMGGDAAGDYALYLALGIDGDLHYMPEAMSVYRLHACGVSQSGDKDWPSKWLAGVVKMLEIFDSETSRAYQKEIAVAVDRELEHHLIGVVGAMKSIGNEEKPSDYVRRYNRAIDKRLKFLSNKDSEQFKQHPSIKSKLGECLIDCGNKFFSSGKHKLAREYYQASIQHNRGSLRTILFLFSTYAPCIRVLIAKVMGKLARSSSGLVSKNSGLIF